MTGIETQTTELRQVSTFGVYTIGKDFGALTVHISKPSPRSRLGIKVVAYYSFRTTDISKSIFRMNQFVDKFIAEKEKEDADLQARKNVVAQIRKDFVSPFTVGQIFYESWGYDQTNVGFFQIISIKGKTVTLQELSQERTDSGFMSGSALPVKDSFIGHPFTRIIQIKVYRGSEKVNISIKGVSAWDGQPKYWSSYA